MDTYGDLVTLLLTFFVLLYSFSSIDAAKWEALVKSFNGTGKVPGNGAPASSEPSEGWIGGPTDPVDRTAEPAVDNPDQTDPTMPVTTTASSESTATSTPHPSSASTQTSVKPASTTRVTTSARSAAMSSLYKELRTQLKGSPLAQGIVIEQKGSQIIIRLVASVIFEPGSDRMVSGAQAIIKDASIIVNKYAPYVKTLRTEGHTDSVTPPEGGIEGKWELAARRAARVLQDVMSQSTINPSKAYTIGYGSARPIASDATAAGQDQNNRVDIVIIS